MRTKIEFTGFYSRLNELGGNVKIRVAGERIWEIK